MKNENDHPDKYSYLVVIKPPLKSSRHAGITYLAVRVLPISLMCCCFRQRGLALTRSLTRLRVTQRVTFCGSLLPSISWQVTWTLRKLTSLDVSTCVLFTGQVFWHKNAELWTHLSQRHTITISKSDTERKRSAAEGFGETWYFKMFMGGERKAAWYLPASDMNTAHV